MNTPEKILKPIWRILANHPRNIEWLKVCDPMQIPLDGYTGWAEMEQVYYNK